MTLLAAYNFDEASGSVLDRSGNGRDLTLSGTTQRTADGTGHTGRALTQGSIEGWTGGQPVYGQTPGRTVMAWVQDTGASGVSDGRLCEWFASSDGNSLFRLTFRGTDWHCQVWNASTFARANTTRPTDGLWHHLAGTYDGTTIRIFLDGVQAAATTFAGPIRTDASIFNVIYQTGSTMKFDDIRIYDTALDAATISSLMGTPVTSGGSVVLSPDSTSHAHTVDSPALTQVHALTPADTVHAHSVESPAVTQVYALTPADSVMSQTVESPTLTQLHVLLPDSTVHLMSNNEPILFNGVLSVSQITESGLVSLELIGVSDGTNVIPVHLEEVAWY